MSEQASINRFRGEFAWLSNFWPVTVKLVGRDFYPTVEHAYQAAKFEDADCRRAIRCAKTPRAARYLAREYAKLGLQRQDWQKVHMAIMTDLLWQKFSKPKLCASLLATKPREIIEGNVHGDEFWGVDLRTGCGENNLGKLLMRVRKRLSKADRVL